MTELGFVSQELRQCRAAVTFLAFHLLGLHETRLSTAVKDQPILGLQSISWDMEDNVNHPRQLDPTMELNIFLCVVPPTWPP